MTNREQVPFPDKDQPLRAEVNFLGGLLGEVLVDQEGASFLEEVEAARADAIARRNGDAEADTRLVRRIKNSKPDSLVALTRAFSSYFALVNQAERIHRIRRRREYHRPGREPQRGSMLAALLTLRDQGLKRDEAKALLESIRLAPVFTAHPTEAARPEILVKELRVARALMDKLERNDATPGEELSIRDRILTEITTGWQTAQNLPGRPEVSEEVEQVIFFLTSTIYAVLPRFLEEVEQAFDQVYPSSDSNPSRGTPTVELSNLIRFGSWVGGDMDGNPNVGPSTLLDSLSRQRAAILQKYLVEARDLAGRLTQTEDRVCISPALQQRLDGYRSEMDREESPSVLSMPYRSFLGYVEERLYETIKDREHAYSGPAELTQDLELIAASLAAGKGLQAGHFRVVRFLQRVRTFGFHLAALDIRQDALVHRQAVGELLGRADFSDLTKEVRVELILSQMQSRSLMRVDLSGGIQSSSSLNAVTSDAATSDAATPGGANLSADTARTLSVFRAIRAARERYGDGAIGIYIVSMARDPDDALAVLFLAQCAGLEEAGRIDLDVAPLFETVDDLGVARSTLNSLFQQPLYREHVQKRDQQYVMLGYSDSSKDSGIAASRWALFQVQEELAQASKDHGVAIRLFHGRGGTVSRGGSKPYAAILSQPSGTVRGHLRVTEQGEVLKAKYGLRGIALRSFELVASAVTEASRINENVLVDPEYAAVAKQISEVAKSTYRQLVHHEPEFIPYFRAATPIDVIERLEIGSRPPSRREQKGVNDLRAIPWVFSWTQSRHIFPGWFGVGSGLAAAIETHGLETLQRVSEDWPYLQSLLGDVEMVLAKADLEIASRYASLAGPIGERIFPIISAEFERTRSLILQIQKTDELLHREPVLKRAILLRNPYVDPMSLVQVDLLEKWRASDRSDLDLERALFVTVKGIARGLQNTG